MRHDEKSDVENVKAVNPTVIGLAADVLDHLQVMRVLVSAPDIRERFGIGRDKYRKVRDLLSFDGLADETLIGRKAFMSDSALTKKLIAEAKNSALFNDGVEPMARSIYLRLKESKERVPKDDLKKEFNLDTYGWNRVVAFVKKSDMTFCKVRLHNKSFFCHPDFYEEHLNDIGNINRAAKIEKEITAKANKLGISFEEAAELIAKPKEKPLKKSANPTPYVGQRVGFSDFVALNKIFTPYQEHTSA